jgi:hypothetical protein
VHVESSPYCSLFLEKPLGMPYACQAAVERYEALARQRPLIPGPPFFHAYSADDTRHTARGHRLAARRPDREGTPEQNRVRRAHNLYLWEVRNIAAAYRERNPIITTAWHDRMRAAGGVPAGQGLAALTLAARGMDSGAGAAGGKQPAPYVPVNNGRALSPLPSDVDSEDSSGLRRSHRSKVKQKRKSAGVGTSTSRARSRVPKRLQKGQAAGAAGFSGFDPASAHAAAAMPIDLVSEASTSPFPFARSTASFPSFPLLIRPMPQPIAPSGATLQHVLFGPSAPMLYAVPVGMELPAAPAVLYTLPAVNGAAALRALPRCVLREGVASHGWECEHCCVDHPAASRRLHCLHGLDVCAECAASLLSAPALSGQVETLRLPSFSHVAFDDAGHECLATDRELELTEKSHGAPHALRTQYSYTLNSSVLVPARFDPRGYDTVSKEHKTVSMTRLTWMGSAASGASPVSRPPSRSASATPPSSGTSSAAMPAATKPQLALAHDTVVNDESNGPRLSQLYSRMWAMRYHSCVCSACGPSRTPYWFCPHCWLSLCAYCYGHATSPTAPAGNPPASGRFLAPMHECRDTSRFPASGLLGQLRAGSALDRSIVHLPVVIVSVFGLGDKGSGGAEHESVRDLWRLRDHQLNPGYGTYPYTIELPEKQWRESTLREKVASVAALVQDTLAVRHLIDCRAHRAADGNFSFGSYQLSANLLVSLVLGPLLDACAFARRHRDTPALASLHPRYPGDDDRPPLVLLACCNTDGPTLARALDDWAAAPGHADSRCELLVFSRPLLLADFPLLQPQLFGRYCDARSPRSTVELLRAVMSQCFVEDYHPVLWSPVRGALLPHQLWGPAVVAAPAVPAPVPVPAAAAASLPPMLPVLSAGMYAIWAAGAPAAARHILLAVPADSTGAPSSIKVATDTTAVVSRLNAVQMEVLQGASSDYQSHVLSRGGPAAVRCPTDDTSRRALGRILDALWRGARSHAAPSLSSSASAP